MIAVVGAGVCGLSSAVALQDALAAATGPTALASGYTITVIADKWTPDTTSDGAGKTLLSVSCSTHSSSTLNCSSLMCHLSGALWRPYHLDETANPLALQWMQQVCARLGLRTSVTRYTL